MIIYTDCSFLDASKKIARMLPQAELMEQAVSLAPANFRNDQVYTTTVAEPGVSQHNMSPPLFAKNVEQWAPFTGLITGGDANVE